MPKYITLANGKTVEFDDGYTDDEIRSYLLSTFDASELVEDAGVLRGAADLAASTGSTLLQGIGGAADLVQTDQAAPLLGADTFAGRAERTLRRVPLIGDVFNKGARAIEVGENALAGIGRAGAGLIREYGPDSLQGLAAGADVGANIVQRQQSERRAAENRLRESQGMPSLEDETAGTFGMAFAERAREMAESAQGARSEESVIEDMQLASAFDEGIGSGLSYAARNPLDTLSVIGPSVAAFLVGGGVAGRGAKLLGAGDEAAAAISLQGQGLASAEMSASGAAETARSMSDEEFAASPMARQLMADGMSEAEAREEMARRAYDAALGFLAPANVALMGAGQALNLNPVESAVIGGRSFTGRIASAEGAAGRLGRAAAGAGAETVSESVEEGADQLGQNIGEIGGGARRGEYVFEGVGTAAALGGLIGGAMGGGVGLMTPARVADAVTSRPNEDDPVAQAQRDVAEIYRSASAPLIGDGADARAPELQAPTEPPAPMTAPPAAQGGAVAAPEAPATAAPQPQPADELEARLFEAGASPVVRPGLTPEDRLAAERLAQQQAAQTPPPSAARGGETPVQDPGAAAGPQSRPRELPRVRPSGPAMRVRTPMPEAAGRGARLQPIPPAAPVQPPAVPVPPEVQAEVQQAPDRISFRDNDAVARAKLERTFLEFGIDPVLANTLAQSDRVPTGAIRDGVTGGFDGRADGVKAETIQRAVDHVEQTGEEAFFVSADISNLGGLNKFHNDVADEANRDFRGLTDIMLEELRATGADVVPMRTGGDEIGYVVVNASQEVVNTALVRAKERAQEYARARGFDQIPHSKEGRTDVGVTFHAGTAAIEPGMSVEEIAKRADLGVNASKKAASPPKDRGNERREATGSTGDGAPEGQAGGAGRGDAAPDRGAGREGGRAEAGPDGEGSAAPQDAAPGVTPEPDQPAATQDAFDSTMRRVLTALGLSEDAVVLVYHPRDLPRGVSRVGLDGRTEGIYDVNTGRVYMFRGALTSPARMVWVAVHELIGHKGLRAAMPPEEFAKMLDAAGTNAMVRGIARAIEAEARADAEAGAEGARPMDPAVFLEEALAEITAAYFTGDMDALIDRYGAGIDAEVRDRAEREKAQSLAKRIIASIKRRLFNSGAPMSDAEVVGLISNAYKSLRAGAAPKTGRASPQSRRELDEDELFELIQESGLNVETTLDAKKAFSNGDAVFVSPEMDEALMKATSLAMIDGYAPDQIVVVPREDYEAATGAPAMQSRSTVNNPGRGVAAGNVHGFWPALRVNAGNVETPRRPLVLAGTKNANARAQLSGIDSVLSKFPNAASSPKKWSEMMAYALGNQDVPVPPYAFIRDINGQGAAEKIKSLTAGQIADADHGFENAAEFRRAYTSGELSVETTGKLFMWSFLSRGVSPYTQESLFIDAFNGSDRWIRMAADGRFDASVLGEYEAWAKSVAPKGSGQPGAGATHNLNAFGKNFLIKMSQRGPDGRSHMQRLHDMMSDSNETGKNIRREFQTFGEGVGIDNKVVSFTLLVAGFNDVMVLDRVQFRQLWDDGKFSDVNLYDGVTEQVPVFDSDGNPVLDGNGRQKTEPTKINGSSLNSLGDGVRGVLVYEAIERAIESRINDIYEAAGRPESASVGRYHWETWVAYSQQEASHGSIGAILSDAKGDDLAIARVYAKQGEYGAYEYGAMYNRAGDGTPWFGYQTPSGRSFAFSVPAFRQFLESIKKPASGVVPRNFKVTEGGNAPWYNRPGVNQEKLDEVAAQFADLDVAEEQGRRTSSSPVRQQASGGAGPGSDAGTGRAGRGLARAGRDAAGQDARAEPRPSLQSRLPGAPVVRGFDGPDPRLVAVAERYARDNGIQLRRQAEYVKVDPERAKRIADAYEAMEHAPNDPRVRAAYDDLIAQTTAQYRALERAGYRFWFIDIASEDGQAYANSPWNAMRDIRANQSMGVFPTEEGFGTDVAGFDPAGNPLLRDTGIRWPFGGPDGELKPVLANDLFRAVHDAFGHGLEGAGFRADGEENAWQAHVRLFTGAAVGAITSETRGQNSWLNFGPFGERNRTASAEETVFAEQKTGLMPEWTWLEGRAGDMGDRNEADQAAGAGADGQPGVRRDDAREAAAGLLQSRSFPADAPAFRQRKQQADAVTAQAIHYSGSPNLAALDGKFAGAGSAGAERRRFGMGQYGAGADPGDTARRLYFYVQDGDTPPRKEDVVAGNNRYAVNLTNLYDADADPRGLREDAGANVDYFEELVNDAGFDGYIVGGLSGIDGRIAIVHGLKKKVPVVSAPMQSRAFHGTPYRGIEKTGFSLQKIGTGEGNQTFGWGLYFAGKREVADWYRSQVKSGQQVGALTESGDRLNFLLTMAGIPSNDQPENMADMAESMLAERSFDERYRPAIERAIADRRAAERDFQGQLYSVEIPDDAELLDSDAPMSRQTESVKAGVRTVLDNAGLGALGLYANQPGFEVYRQIADKLGSERAASEALLTAGIPGLRYLDGSSRGAGKGSRNYVIWDEGAISDVAPMLQSRAPQTREFREWFAGSRVVDYDGKPLRVYHGTIGKDFDRFERKTGAYATQAGSINAIGSWFTDSPEDASMYAGNGKAEGGQVMPAYLSIKRPFRISSLDGLIEMWKIRAGGNDRLQNGDPEKFREALMEAGYDGLVIEAQVVDKFATEGSQYWVAFESNQIKSIFNDRPTGDPRIMQSRAAREARATAAQLRQRKSQLARELTTNMLTADQVKSWTNRARLLIGEVAVSPDFAQELADAKRALGPERRAALAGDRKALAEYDNIRDMIGVIDEGMRNARAKQAEANRLLDKVERRTSTMSLAEREALVEQLAVALDSAEMAYVAAKRIADWRSKNDFKIIKAHRKRTETLDYLASEGFQQGSFLWQSGDLKEKAASVKRKFRRALQDRMIDMRDVQEQIERELGITLDDMQNVYRQENLMHGRVADAIDGFRQRLVDPLKRVIKDSGMSMAEVEEYLWARHAEERNAKIRAIRPGVDDGSGMTDQQARDILARFTPEQNVQLARISRLVDGIRRNTLETMVASGQLDREGADRILASYKHYVPLRGKDGEGEERVGGGTGTGQGISAGRSGVQRALGRKTPPKNILAELVGDSERAIVQAGKAEVGRALLRLALSYPNKDLWEVEPVELRPKFNESTGEVYLEIVNDDSSSVIVKHNGRPYKVAIRHPRLVAALRNTGTEGMQWVVQYFGALNRWLSAVFTRFNPGFVPVNMARDILQGVTGLAAELGASSAAKVAGYYGPAGWASLKDAREQRGDASVPDDRKSMEDWAREFAESGGKTGYTAIDDADKMQRDIEQSMMSIWQVAKDNKLNVLGTIGTAFERMPGIKAIEDLNEAVENALRLATYTHLRKDKGWTRQRAAEYAKEMTVNFNRKGTVGSVVNALYLFFNAAVQGSRRTIKLMKHPKVQVVLGSLMAGQWLLATSLGMATFGDDDETLWEKIPDHVKRRSFVIPTGFDDNGTARYISIPMPFGFNIFPSTGGYFANYSSPHWRGRMGDDVGKHFVEAFAYTSSTAIDALSPVPIGEEGFMYPTLVGIGVDLARNRDDLDRRIRPSDEFSQFEAPRAGMANPGTATPFLFAAKALNRLGGGDDYNAPKFMPGLLDVSPNELEYLFNTFAGGPGTTLTQGWRAAAREVAVGDMASFDIPVARAVSGGVRPEQREAARFYDNKDRIERNLERLRDAYAEGGVESYKAMQLELGPAYYDIQLRVRKEDSDTGPGKAGEVMVNEDGRPQFVAPDGSLLGTYREAKRDLTAINREIRRVFNDRSIGVVERQRRLVELQREREVELREFNRLQSRYDASRGSE